LDYEGGGCPSLLLEPQSTNLYSYSNQFDVFWSKTNLSAIPNSIISLDGNLNGYFLRENTANGSHDIRQNATVVSGSKYTYSVFVKKSDVGQVRNLSFYIGGTNGSISFNTSDGTFFSVGSVDNYASEDYGNGWWRLQFTDTAISASFNVIAILNNASTIYQGDGVSGVYIYGAQLEQSSYATSYIPTSGSAQTRLAETANDAGNASTFNDSEGVLFADISAWANDETLRKVQVNDNTGNNNITIDYYSSSNSIRANLWNGSSQYSYIYTLTDVTLSTKVAFLYKSSEFKFYVNGIKVNESSSGSTFPSGTLKTLDLSTSNGSSPFYGKTKQIQYYNTALTDLELETLTSYTSFNAMALAQNYTI